MCALRVCAHASCAVRGVWVLCVCVLCVLLWQELRSAEKSAPVLNSLEVPTAALEECPHVASVLHSLDPDTLDWLTATYLVE